MRVGNAPVYIRDRWKRGGVPFFNDVLFPGFILEGEGLRFDSFVRKLTWEFGECIILARPHESAMN